MQQNQEEKYRKRIRKRRRKNVLRAKSICRTSRESRQKHVWKILTVSLMVISAVFGYTVGHVRGSKAAEIAVQTETEAQAAAEAETSTEETADINAVDAADDSSLDELDLQLQEMIEEHSGTWSVYVKDLSSEATLSINNQSMYAASLIKLFVMENSFRNMDTLVSNISAAQGLSETQSQEEIMSLMSSMITVSDNESYNEMVRLWSVTKSFTDGCRMLEMQIEAEGYANTGIYHTLLPSISEYETTGDGENHTCVEDCGLLLESIYRGTCVSEEASQQMLDLLLAQTLLDKIPSGCPSGITVANKTGETEQSQHDAAIVFGEQTDYILCIMSTQIQDEPDIYAAFQDISALVYAYLNSSSV